MSKTIGISILSLFIVSLLLGSFSAHARPQNKMLCPAYYAWKLKDNLAHSANDKLKHCTLSCWLGRRCAASEVMMIGVAKEVADALGMGNSEWDDVVADARGIKLSFGASSDTRCYRRCQQFYP
jgi:hypothetical protein